MALAPDLPAGSPFGTATDPSLHRRLTLLTALRLGIVTALLCATTYVTLSPQQTLEPALVALLFGIIAFIYAASLAYLWLLRKRRLLGTVAWAQVVGDLLVATFLVYLTGGVESLFTLLYPLAIINASILLPRTGALLSGASGTVLFALLSVGLALGLIPPAAPYLAQRHLAPGHLVFVLAGNASAFFLTAVLASYLTEQIRRTSESLEAREVDYAALSELLGAIVRSMPTGIVTTGHKGLVTFVNPAAEAIVARAFSQMVERPLAALLPSLAAGVDSALARGLTRGEVDEQDGHGELKRLSFVVSPMTRAPKKGPPEPGLAVVFEDLTQMRAMQEAVRRSDRLAAVGQLAAGLAHELRNPLASMTGAVDLLGRNAALSTGETRLLDIVMREGERLNALVNDFLLFARPTEPAREASDVAAIADETLKVFQHSPLAAGLELTRTGEASARLFVDPSQLRQVLWNLLQNAAEAMAGSGRIDLDVSWAPNGWVKVAVGDTGSGIAEADFPHLFEPFFTTKPQGTGLGLASVHRIVEAHGGRVEVDSASGRTTVAVLLPVGQAAAVRALAP